MSQGVKQGCKISPTFFAIYINDLSNELKTLNCGIQLNISQVSTLIYADDIAFIAPDEEKLQKMLNIVNEWCRK